MELVKVARVRHADAPVGVPAPLYLKCPCGHTPEDPAGDDVVACACGRRYTSGGWLVR
jgi:hypothetical protein